MNKVVNLIKPYYDKVLHITYQNKKVSSYFEMIEQKSGINRGFIIAGVFAILAIYLIFGYAAQLVCNVIGFVYPAFASVKALESHRKDDDTRWLTYWVVFALFSTAEFFTDILLSWFPFYWLAKCLFLIWCFLPVPWNGSTFIYSRFVRPYFLKNQKQIDSTISNVKDSLDEVATKVPNFINYEGSKMSN